MSIYISARIYPDPTNKEYCYIVNQETGSSIRVKLSFDDLKDEEEDDR